MNFDKAAIELMKNLTPKEREEIDNWMIAAVLTGVMHDQVFSYHIYEENKWYHFNASKVLKAIKSGKLVPDNVKVDLNDECISHIIDKGGVDLVHAENLTTEQLKVPVLIVKHFNGDIIIDGNHRMVKWFNLGLKEGMAYMLKWEDITPYLEKFPPAIEKFMVCDIALRRE